MRIATYMIGKKINIERKQQKLLENWEPLVLILVTIVSDLLRWKINENYIFSKIDKEKMPDIVISDKIYELTKLIYKDPEILYPIDLSLEFLSPK